MNIRLGFRQCGFPVKTSVRSKRSSNNSPKKKEENSRCAGLILPSLLQLFIMTYKAIGLMSGSSLDGLDIVFTSFTEQAGTWTFELLASDCYEYNSEWKEHLQSGISLPALEYQLLHVAYGHYLGEQVNRFIDENDLHFKVALVASHGHTTFHV